MLNHYQEPGTISSPSRHLAQIKQRPESVCNVSALKLASALGRACINLRNERRSTLGRRNTQQPSGTERDGARLGVAAKLCVYGVLAGTAVLFLGLIMTWTTGWGAALVAPGATLVIAGIAGMVTTKSVVTWSEQRERDAAAGQYRHREEVYGKILENMVKAFVPGGNPDIHADAALRALASLWAGPETVEALARWREEIRPAVKRGGVIGDDREKIMARYAAVVVAMRADLSGDPNNERHPEPRYILGSIFDDRPGLPPELELQDSSINSPG